MLTVLQLSPAVRVEVLGEAPSLPEDLEREVQRLWQAEQGRRGGKLFNGRILSAVEVTTTRICGNGDEYRRLIAQRSRPELFAALRVRPVAVSGVLHCADGVVFGRRARWTTQDACMWELAPAGGVDLSEAQGTRRVDLQAQILAELGQEIGLMPDRVTEAAPFCLIEDGDAHVLDIGMALQAPGVSAEAIGRAHRERGTSEYSAVMVVREREVAGFLERTDPGVAAVSRALWRAYTRQPGPDGQEVLYKAK